jgi:hypothetical protein
MPDESGFGFRTMTGTFSRPTRMASVDPEKEDP